MARLLRLRGRDFQGLREVDIDVSAPITMVIGRNATGKTSTADLIRYLLLGRCQGTDADGKGAGFLVRRGASELWGELTLEHEGQPYIVARAKNTAGEGAAKLHCPDGPVLTGKGVQARLEEILGAHRDVVEAVLDSSYVLTLDQRKRSDLLMRLADVRVSLREIDDAAAALNVSAEGRARLQRGIVGIAGTAAVCPDHLTEAKKRCEAKRRDARRERDDARSAFDQIGPVTGSESELAAALSALNAETTSLANERDELNRRSGELSARKAERGRVARQIAGLRERTEALPLDPVPGPSEGPTLFPNVIEVEIRKLRDRRTTAEDALKPLRSAASKARETADALSRTMAGIESGSTTCLHSAYAGRPCAYVQADLEERIKTLPELRERAGRAETAAAKAEKKVVEAEAALTELVGSIEAAEAKLAEAQRNASRGMGARAALEQQIADLTAVLAGLPDAAAEISELTERFSANGAAVAAVQERKDALIRDLQAVQQLRSAQQRVKKAEREFAVWQELVAVLDPKALPARVAAPRIAPLRDHINLALATITANRYRIDIVVGDGFDIDVYDAEAGHDEPLYLDKLSASEKLRIGVAIGYAVAVTTGVRILLADAADLLDDDNRTTFLRGIAAMRDRIDTAVICSTASRNSVSTGPLWTVYRTSQGRLTQVVAKDAPQPVAP